VYQAYVSTHPVDKDNSIFSVLIEGEQNFQKTLALKMPANQAEMIAICFAALAIKDQAAEIEIFTTNNYIISLLDKKEDGSWARNSKYIDSVMRLREIVERPNVHISYGSGDNMEKVRWLAKAMDRLKDHPLKEKIKMP